MMTICNQNCLDKCGTMVKEEMSTWKETDDGESIALLKLNGASNKGLSNARREQKSA